MSGKCARCGSYKILEPQPVDRDVWNRAEGLGVLVEPGYIAVNDLQTKLEKKTRAVGSICCWVRSGIKMTTQTFQIRFHTQTKHEAMAMATATPAKKSRVLEEWNARDRDWKPDLDPVELRLKMATTLAHRVRHRILVYFVLLKRLMAGQVGGWAGCENTRRRLEMDTISVQFMLHGAAAAITIASCLSCNSNGQIREPRRPTVCLLAIYAFKVEAATTTVQVELNDLIIFARPDWPGALI